MRLTIKYTEVGGEGTKDGCSFLGNIFNPAFWLICERDSSALLRFSLPVRVSVER